MKIFLDDIRATPDKYNLTFKHAENLIEWLKNNPTTPVELLSLDHDLNFDSNNPNGNYMTGYDFIKKLPDISNNIKMIQFHTSNTPGLNNMYHTLVSYKNHNYLPNLEEINTVPVDVVDGVESPILWIRLKPKT